MLIISVRDKENNRWKKNPEKKTKTEKNKDNKSYSERVRAKWFVVVCLSQVFSN